MSSDRSEFAMAFSNKFTNHVSEYWYIGSILAKSVMVKNRMVECTAIGV